MLIWPLFRFWGRNLSIFLLVFLGEFKKSKRHSEINCPLGSSMSTQLALKKKTRQIATVKEDLTGLHPCLFYKQSIKSWAKGCLLYRRSA